MGRPSTSAQHKSEVLRLHDEGKSISEIAVAIGSTASSVRRWLQDWGKDTRTKKERLAADVVADYAEGMPTADICAKYEVASSSVQRWVRESDSVQPRPRGGFYWGGSKPTKQVSSECAQCDKEFTYNPGQRAGKYCSKECHLIDLAKKKSRPKCPCGNDLFASGEYAHTSRKYCSADCRSRYGKPNRIKDPSKWVSFECQTCGKTTERRKSVPGPRKFCSNECAAKHTKAVRHYVARESDMILDSTWEMMFAGQCGWHKVECLRFDRTQAIEWEPGHWYGPDFVLPELGIFVEVKGFEDPEDDGRWATFRDRVGPLAIVDRAGMDRIRTAATRADFIEALQT